MIYACGVPLITFYLCSWVYYWIITKQNHYYLKIIKELKILIVSLYISKILSVDPLNSYKKILTSGRYAKSMLVKLLGKIKKNRGEGNMSDISNKSNCLKTIRQCNKRGHKIKIILDIFNKNMPNVQSSIGFNMNIWRSYSTKGDPNFFGSNLIKNKGELTKELVPLILEKVNKGIWPMEDKNLKNSINNYIQLNTHIRTVQTSLKFIENNNLVLDKKNWIEILNDATQDIESIIYKVKAIDLIEKENQWLYLDKYKVVKSPKIALNILTKVLALKKQELKINLAKGKTDQTIARKGLENLNKYELTRRNLKQNKKEMIDLRQKLKLIYLDPVKYLKELVEKNKLQNNLLRFELLNNLRNVKLSKYKLDQNTLKDKTLQMLLKLVMESYLEPLNKNKDCNITIDTLYNLLKNKKINFYIFQGEIQCISHNWLLNTVPIPEKYRYLLSILLKTEIIEREKNNEKSILYPLLMNWTLNGGVATHNNIVRYANNLVVITKNPENLNREIDKIKEFLKIRGLKLSKEIITQWKLGSKIDFLGWTIHLIKPTKVNFITKSKYADKLIDYKGTYIYPSKKSTEILKAKIKNLTSLTNSRKSVDEIIKSITLIIIDWSNYFIAKPKQTVIRQNLDWFILNRFKKFLRIKYGKTYLLHFKKYLDQRKFKHKGTSNFQIQIGVNNQIPKLTNLYLYYHKSIQLNKKGPVITGPGVLPDPSKNQNNSK